MRKILFLLIISGIFCSADILAKDKTKKYKNGDVYVGEIVKGLPEGKGTMTYANGDVYTGNWYKGDPDGQGTMTYVDNSTYSGHWREGKRQGMGTFKYQNGDVFTGKWQSNERSEGTLTIAGTNCVYEGSFDCFGNGKFTQGAIIKDDYIGRVIQGEIDMLVHPNGTELKGEIEFDGESFEIIKAEGTYVLDSLRVFKGSMRDGKFYDGEITTTPNQGDKELVYKEHYNSGKVNVKTWIVPSELSVGKYARAEFRIDEGHDFPNGIEYYVDDDTEHRTFCKYTGTFAKSGEVIYKHGHGIFEGWHWLTIEGEWENDVLVSGKGSYVQRQLTVATTNGKANLTVKSKYGTYNKTVSPDTCSVLDEAAHFVMDIFNQEDKAHYKEEQEAQRREYEKKRQAERAKNMREGRKVFHACPICLGRGYTHWMETNGIREYVTCIKCGGTKGYWDY